MKKLRPLSSEILAIWALAGRAHSASEPSIRHAVSVTLLLVMAFIMAFMARGKLMFLFDLTPP
jgi:hypothetical protein